MRDEWIDFLPVLIIFLFVCYPDETATLSETGLGKLFAVFVIVCYASVDLTYGLFACAVIILYYQMEFAAGIWTVERSQLMHESMQDMYRELGEARPYTEAQAQAHAQAQARPVVDTRLVPTSVSLMRRPYMPDNGPRSAAPESNMVGTRTMTGPGAMASGYGGPEATAYEPFDTVQDYRETIITGGSSKRELMRAMSAQERGVIFDMPGVSSVQDAFAGIPSV